MYCMFDSMHPEGRIRLKQRIATLVGSGARVPEALVVEVVVALNLMKRTGYTSAIRDLRGVCDEPQRATRGNNAVVLRRMKLVERMSASTRRVVVAPYVRAIVMAAVRIVDELQLEIVGEPEDIIERVDISDL